MVRGLESVVVAFSGGVDSALVAAVAHRILGKNALAVTARSNSFPKRELVQAKSIAKEIGIKHYIIFTDEMKNPEYMGNSIDRCFHCKVELYKCLHRIAKEQKFRHIVNGVNSDDLDDYRPGISAAREVGIRTPLSDAGMNKEDTRALARELGLSMADKPASACLSSRIPYGQSITPEKLSMIEKAEDFLLDFGFTQLRVRHHGDIARIELLPEEIPHFFIGEIANSTENRFRELGFKFVAIDTKGYRTGSLNEVLEK